ncbi:26324_t:CDS:1, partial [Racocetra persica]
IQLNIESILEDWWSCLFGTLSLESSSVVSEPSSLVLGPLLLESST